MKTHHVISISMAIILATVFTGITSSYATKGKPPEDVELTFMLIGDTHGHMLPRPNLRRDAENGLKEGGYARLMSKIKAIRKQNPGALLFMAGDTLQGGVEALYSKGQSAIDVFDTFGINAFAPGNWDFLYGRDRFLEVFGADRWGIVCANLYYEEGFADPVTRKRVVAPYRILKRKGIKIGVIGLTAERGILAVPGANDGFILTKAKDELPSLVAELRPQVDVMLLLSELGLAKNSLLAEEYPQFDLVFSSDMHEEVPNPIIIGDKQTIVTEMGHDGTGMIKLVVELENRIITDKDYSWIDINNEIRPDKTVSALIKKISAEFDSGPAFRPHTNPLSGYVLNTPADTVVGSSYTRLYRYDFTDDPMPGVIEGASHDFLTDAFRERANSDFAMIIGFRYGTHVPPGAITLRDLYHYLPAGAQIAKGTVSGQHIKNVLENNIDGALNKDPFKWTGGWLFGYSGLKFDVDLTVPKGGRAQQIMIYEKQSGLWRPLELSKDYIVAGFWFPLRPQRIGVFTNVPDVMVLTQADGSPKDATAVVMDYLETTGVDPQVGRIRLLTPLPEPVFDNPEVQPLRGATLE